MEPYKRLLDRRWDDLSARISQLEHDLDEAKRTAAGKGFGSALFGRLKVTVYKAVENTFPLTLRYVAKRLHCYHIPEVHGAL